MSFDLAVWYSPGPVTYQQAYATYLLLCGAEDADETTPWPELHESVEAFYRDLTERYPTHDALGDDEAAQAACPWMDDPYPDDRFLRANGWARDHVIVHIAWPRAGEMRSVVGDVAFKHGLVMLDPQNETVQHPF